MKKVSKIIAGAAVGVSAVVAGASIMAQVTNPYIASPTMLSKTASSTIAHSGNEQFMASTNHPRIEMDKFNGETKLGVTYTGIPQTTKGSRPLFSKNVEWKGTNQTMQAIPLESNSTLTDGGYEINVILNQKPTSNVFNFTIDGYENLNFYYQGPLWYDGGLQAPTDDCSDTYCTHFGTHQERPENVVDSYAVYYKNHSDYCLNCGTPNYATGKAYHIYRPKVTDAKGASVWADMHYANGILSVSVPQSFLDTASYPVTVDPTFGYTTQGASEDDTARNFVWLKAFTTPASNGTLTSISIYGRTTGTGIYSPAIYSDDGASPDKPASLLAAINNSPTTNTGATALMTVSISYGNITSGTQYWLGTGQGTDSAGNDMFYKFDTGASNTLYFTLANPVGLAWPSTTGGSFTGTAAEKGSIYGTYTSNTGNQSSIVNVDAGPTFITTYHDNFVVGADTSLSTYQPNWIDTAQGAPLSVRSATSDVREPTAANADFYYWGATTNPNQQITCTLNVNLSGGSFAQLAVRQDSLTDGYYVRWDPSGTNTLTLFRIWGSGVNFAVLDTFGSAGGGTTTFNNAFVQAITQPNGSVAITYGDGTNGSKTYIDNDGNQLMTGTPGMGLSNTTSLSGFITNVSINQFNTFASIMNVGNGIVDIP